MACPDMDDIKSKFESFTQKPVNYLSVQSDIKEDLKSFVKTLYDYTKSEEKIDKKSKRSALPELIIQDFDEEQIWQEIELQNSECWDRFVWEVANCISGKNNLIFPIETSKPIVESMDEEVPSLGDQNHLSNDGAEIIMPAITEKQKKIKKRAKKKLKPSIVDDKFFKLQEMEQFLIDGEKKEGKGAGAESDDESIDYFKDDDDDDNDVSGEGGGGNDVMYNDFFDQEENDCDNDEDDECDRDDIVIDENYTKEQETKKKKLAGNKNGKGVTFANSSSDDGSEEELGTTNGLSNQDKKKSEFEERQYRLQQQISRLEEKSLKESPWQLKGEVDAIKRPQNSLLQEVVDFDLTSRPAPIITEETTVTLEDIIKRRVKDKAWDDVVRKEKPVDDQLSFRKPEIMDQSKSKLSLAQVYEAEYLKQKQALSGDAEEEKEPESHVEIREAMSKLFSKLDALCHYHYTPRAPQAEVKIVSNTPAISMEEVAPVATSDAALLAPEEVKKKRRGELMSKEERTNTDKKRERRKKKQLQKSKEKVEKVTENRNTKKAFEASDKSLKTSKAFFQQLNDDSTSLIKTKNKRNVKNKG